MDWITNFLVVGMLFAFLAIIEYIRFARAREEIYQTLQVQKKRTRRHWLVKLVGQMDSWTRIQGWGRSLQRCYYAFRPSEWLFVLVVVCIVMCFFLRWVLDSSWVSAGIISFFLVLWIHKSWLWLGEIRYHLILQSQIPELCRFMSIAVLAGKSIYQAIDDIVDHLDSPLKEEMQICRDELKMGIHLEQVLNRLEKRVNLPELYFLTRVFRLHMQNGLDLSYFMQRISILMEEQFRTNKVVQSTVVQVKYTAILLSIFSFLIVMVFSKLFGGYEDFLQSWLGLNVVILFVGIQFFGYWMIYRINRFRGV